MFMLIHSYAGTDFVRNHGTEVCFLETNLFGSAFSKGIVDTSCVYTRIFPDTFYLPLEVTKTLEFYKYFSSSMFISKIIA